MTKTDRIIFELADTLGVVVLDGHKKNTIRMPTPCEVVMPIFGDHELTFKLFMLGSRVMSAESIVMAHVHVSGDLQLFILINGEDGFTNLWIINKAKHTVPPKFMADYKPKQGFEGLLDSIATAAYVREWFEAKGGVGDWKEVKHDTVQAGRPSGDRRTASV